jgi:uncharacterized protein
MPIPVLDFLAHPGRRFPFHAVLRGIDQDEGDLRTVGEIEIDGQAFAQLTTLYLDVDLQARIEQPCRRCLTPIRRVFTLHESFELPIPPGEEAVDVRPMAVSLVLSADDPNRVCKSDCRGLCPICGTDLNEQPNHVCEEAAVDRHALKDFLTQ